MVKITLEELPEGLQTSCLAPERNDAVSNDCNTGRNDGEVSDNGGDVQRSDRRVGQPVAGRSSSSGKRNIVEESNGDDGDEAGIDHRLNSHRGRLKRAKNQSKRSSMQTVRTGKSIHTGPSPSVSFKRSTQGGGNGGNVVRKKSKKASFRTPHRGEM
ncbi:hypothetical protein FGB62_172g015 [Gracilaria domingensis]|nr:hypothetical protein FGB62_172g015 [Gracilaria domingensis]